jgi:PilZ domain-containing protein
MAGNERRISPRKECSVPVRFRVATNGSSEASESASEGSVAVATKLQTRTGILEGETSNLSERGIAFRSRENLAIGAPLEMYLTLPRELTGRRAEEVRCRARVVHVDSRMDARGQKAFGAVVERFEPVKSTRSWAN